MKVTHNPLPNPPWLQGVGILENSHRSVHEPEHATNDKNAFLATDY